jgi:hypothetical protein
MSSTTTKHEQQRPVSDETQPFGAQPASTTEEYTRPPKMTWRQQGEHYIDRVRDTYDAAWDLMPAIAAGATLIWLINTFHR